MINEILGQNYSELLTFLQKLKVTPSKEMKLERILLLVTTTASVQLRLLEFYWKYSWRRGRISLINEEHIGIVRGSSSVICELSS